MNSANYQIFFSHAAQKDFRGFPEGLRKRIVASIKKLEESPYHGADIRKLRGQYKGLYRLRVGQCRVIFRIEEEEKTVEVVSIIHRSKGY